MKLFCAFISQKNKIVSKLLRFKRKDFSFAVLFAHTYKALLLLLEPIYSYDKVSNILVVICFSNSEKTNI